MNNDKDKDYWKDSFRAKFSDESVSSNNDETLWENVLAEIEERPKKISFDYVWYAAAASVVIMLMTGVGFYLSKKSITEENLLISQSLNKKEADKYQTETLVYSDDKDGLIDPTIKKEKKKTKVFNKTASFIPDKTFGANQMVRKELADGSVITINKNAVLTLDKRFSDIRNTRIKGEAFFEIAENKSKPFTVYFRDSKLVVVGTKFNVYSGNDGSFEVSVTEGIVKVYPDINKEGITVLKGQQLRMNSGEEAQFSEVNVSDYILWTSSEITFSKSKLSEVATILSRMHNTNIHIAEDIKNCKFSGDLTGVKLEEGLEIIKMTLNLQIKEEKGEIYISGSSCD